METGGWIYAFALDHDTDAVFRLVAQFPSGLEHAVGLEFDRDTGFLWIGDVGQDEVEEVDVVDVSLATSGYGTPNHNFGWPRREGPDNTGNHNACNNLDAVDTHLSRIYLAGGSALVAQLPKAIQDRSRIPVEIFDPFTRVAVDARRFHVDYLRANAPVAAIAFGLALRRTGDSA